MRSFADHVNPYLFENYLLEFIGFVWFFFLGNNLACNFRGTGCLCFDYQLNMDLHASQAIAFGFLFTLNQRGGNIFRTRGCTKTSENNRVGTGRRRDCWQNVGSVVLQRGVVRRLMSDAMLMTCMCTCMICSVSSATWLLIKNIRIRSKYINTWCIKK